MNHLNRLRILVFIRFCGEALFFPFLSLFLASAGFTTGDIGLFIALIPITSCICAPIYSFLCKTPKQAKIALTVMTFIEPIFIVLLLLSENFALSCLSIVCIGIFSSSNYGLLESFMALSCRAAEKPFSAVRLFGSISYTLAVLISGSIVKYFGYFVLFMIAVILFAITGILYCFIQAPKTQEKQVQVSLKEILSNKWFIGYLIFYILTIGSMQVGDDFFSLYLQAKGSPDYLYAYVTVGFVCVEIIIMACFRFLYKKMDIAVFFLAAMALVIRFSVQMLPTADRTWLIAFQMLRGVVWGLILSLNSLFVVKILGFDSSTRGIVLVTFGLSIFTSIFKFCGGYIIEQIGYPRFYAILWGISLFGLIYFTIYYFLYRKYASPSKNYLF